MKKLLTTLLFVLSVCAFTKAEQTNNLLATSDTVIWAGLDYSMVKMIGRNKSDSPYGFTDAQKIFPDMLEKWNRLFLVERMDVISKALGRDVQVDIDGVTERNKTTSKGQLILSAHIRDVMSAPNITPTDIINEIRCYKMQNTNGLGLVFVIDKLVEAQFNPPVHNPNYGAIYVVFFDVATRKVIYTNREEYEIRTGGKFQNFWFGPIKDADETLVKFYRIKKSTAATVPIRPHSK